jgi:hypothetical protein
VPRGTVARVVRLESKLPGAWVPADSRLLASLASGAGMTKWDGAPFAATGSCSTSTVPIRINRKAL